MLLDFCLSEEIYSQSRRYLNELKITELSFHEFLLFYCKFSGVANMTSTYSLEKLQENNSKRYFIPTVHGTWHCVEGKIVDTLKKSSLPFAESWNPPTEFTQNQTWNEAFTNDNSTFNEKNIPSIFLMYPISNQQEIFSVKREDLEDIFMLAGLPHVEKESIDYLLTKFRWFLNFSDGDENQVTILVR